MLINVIIKTDFVKFIFITFYQVAVLSGHSGMITSVNFCPISCNGVYYLVSTSTDGSVAFWTHTKKGNERAVFQ